MENSAIPVLAALFLLLFVLITKAELWFLKWLGFDAISRLQVTIKQGKMLRFFFEAFGVVAFIMVQPVVLAWLFSKLPDDIARHLHYPS